MTNQSPLCPDCGETRDWHFNRTCHNTTPAEREDTPTPFDDFLNAAENSKTEDEFTAATDKYKATQIVEMEALRKSLDVNQTPGPEAKPVAYRQGNGETK